MIHDYVSYVNGNAIVTIDRIGTRIVETPDAELKLVFPLNVDVRLSQQCAYGRNPNNGKSVCGFCHESATTDGRHASRADIDVFFANMDTLPAGAEIAVGINQFTEEVGYFLTKCYDKCWIANATVNQGFIKRDFMSVKRAIIDNTINGLGISYRSHAPDIPPALLQYENTVVHVIAGIDTIDEVKALAAKGIKKILVLGEKDFGFNLGKVKLISASHKKWYREIYQLFELFDVVSFDNLALDQLKVKRFVKNWEQMYQHEFSFYANIVDGTFAPSSRSSDTTSMKPVREYFDQLFQTNDYT